MANNVTYNVVNSHGVILDTHMSSSTGYLYGYNSSYEYWHYVTATGYSNYYDSNPNIIYFDPSPGAGRFGAHTLSSSDFVSLLRDRGIVG